MREGQLDNIVFNSILKLMFSKIVATPIYCIGKRQERAVREGQLDNIVFNSILILKFSKIV